jgi:hypothetical protein
VNALLLTLALIAQAPDRRGEVVLEVPTYKGTTASANIKPSHHIQNEGGSDGAGLCVVASMVIAGAHHGVGDLPSLKGSDLWRAAKQAPGGYYPEKFQRLITKLDPKGEKYPVVQDTQADSATLDEWSKKGWAFGVTMNTGQQYGYKRIAHMVTGVHYRSGDLACIVDNNFPGRYSWMPAAELDRRRDGWAMHWDVPAVAVRFVWLAWWPLVAAVVLVVAGRVMARPAPVRA